MERKLNQNKMGIGSVNRLLITMAAPMIISMLIGALYNIVDSLFVARYSENALTAVSLAFPVQNIIIACGTGIGVGASSSLSKYLGAGEHKKVTVIAVNSLLIGIAAYLMFLIFGFFMCEWFFNIQTDNKEIINMGYSYLKICSVFSFGQLFQLILEKLLQSTGRTFYTMISQIAGAIVNIILDPIFIFGYFNFPSLGAAGAAIATVIGQTVSLFLCIYFNLKKNKEIDFSLRNFALDISAVKEICKVGIPTIIMQAMSSIMIFGVNMILLGFSVTATAVFGAYFKLQTFVYMAVFGLNNALIPIVAFNYGAKNGDRIRTSIKFAGLYSLFIGLIGFLLLQLFTTQIIEMFNPSDDMLQLGISALRILSLSFAFGSTVVMMSYALQGLGKGLSSLFLSASRQCIVLLPLAYIFGNIFGLSFIWWSFLISEAVTFIGGLIYMKYVDRKIVIPLVNVPLKLTDN